MLERSRGETYCRCAHRMQEERDSARKEVAKLQAEITYLNADAEEVAQLQNRLSSILTRTAIALHGGPLEMGLWSWGDLPELAAALRTLIDPIALNLFDKQHNKVPGAKNAR